MQTYAEYSPTAFDARGAFLPDQREWFVLPVIQTRDSGILDQSNFAVALEWMGGESDTCEVHRFGHWACGWMEIILVHPDRAAQASKIEASLADYPVLSDDDYSTREWYAACDTWGHMRLRERIEACDRFGASIFAARRDSIPECPSGEIVSWLAGS